MLTAPLVVHCCHCHWRQRETGTAFALNATLPPDVRILTAFNRPWVTPSDNVPRYAGFYERKDVWRQESLDRFDALRPEIAKYRASLQMGPA